jgi:hypothetical protein
MSQFGTGSLPVITCNAEGKAETVRLDGNAYSENSRNRAAEAARS